MWSTVVQEGLFEVFSLYSSLCSKCLVEMDNSKVRYAPHFTLLLPSHYTHTHTCTPTCTPTHPYQVVSVLLTRRFEKKNKD